MSIKSNGNVQFEVCLLKNGFLILFDSSILITLFHISNTEAIEGDSFMADIILLLTVDIVVLEFTL